LFHVVNRTTENILGTGVVQPTAGGDKSPAQADEVGGLMFTRPRASSASLRFW
jgi:hypothetical protein